MRYICLDCGELFDDPVKRTERHGLETPPYEVKSGCPKCGGAYVVGVPCECCGEIIDNEYIKTFDGHVYCSECVTHCNIWENQLSDCY